MHEFLLLWGHKSDSPAVKVVDRSVTPGKDVQLTNFCGWEHHPSLGTFSTKITSFVVYKSTLIVRFHTDKWAVSMD